MAVRDHREHALPYFAARLCLLSVLVTAGCSTYADRIRLAHTQFYTGDLEPAAETLTEYMERYPRDADAAALDLAMVQLASGRPQDAEQTLRRVRDNLDNLDQSSALESGLSMLTDDQRLAYSGQNYEKVLTRVFLALTNLLHDGQDAEAYTLQVNAKQEELLQKADAEEKEKAALVYSPLAIAPYLRGVIREATLGNYDDASRAYHQVVNWQPGFQAAQADLARAQNGVHSQPGNGVLYVFALVNRGPAKEEMLEIPTTAALLIADRILSAVGEYDVPPTLAPIKVPRIVVPPRDVHTISVVIDQQPIAHTETICDVAELALRQEEIEFPHIMARAIARRVVKKAAIYATKDIVQADQPLADIALSAVGVAWEATEAADTRCWALLPREIQVVRLELPAGRHQIQLTPQLTSGRQVAGPAGEVEIGNGRNTYMLACFPGPRAVGQVLQRQ
ncbi:MAG: hypothetical protein ACYC0X_14300 [Pirellulaceae bacterium]